MNPVNIKHLNEHYISPYEIKHWIPKARLHIKDASQNLEFPEYKNKPDTTMIVMCGTDSITPISYAYGSLGLAFELIYKTLAISNFKPLYMGSRGHKLKSIHYRLNVNTQRVIESFAQELIQSFNINEFDYSKYNFNSIIEVIDEIMVNPNVKYNNVPNKKVHHLGFVVGSSFEAFGYNRTQSIIKFMCDIADFATNLLSLALHVICNYANICPELSDTNQEHRKLIFEKCSEFVSSLEIKICSEDVILRKTGVGEVIERRDISFITDESSICELFQCSLGLGKKMGLINSLNGTTMTLAARGYENISIFDMLKAAKYIVKIQ